MSSGDQKPSKDEWWREAFLDITRRHPLLMPSPAPFVRRILEAANQEKESPVTTCQICGAAEAERDWYTGDVLCVRCKLDHSEARRRHFDDRYTEGMIECSDAVRVPNSDRMWAIQPYRGGG